MFADAFIHFLRENKRLNDKQVREVLTKRVPKVRPSVIAFYDNLITEKQAKELSKLQMMNDMPFSFLAVREGFLTNEQMSRLLGRNSRDDMRVIQVLSDKGFMSMSAVMDNLKSFRSFYGLDDEAYNGLVDNKPEYYVSHIGKVKEKDDIFAIYASVFLRAFIRCIGDSPRIESARALNEIHGRYMVKVVCEGERDITLGVIYNDEASALNLAGRFVKQHMREYGEDAEDSLKEFMSVVSGLLVTALEKDFGLDIELNVPEMIFEGYFKNECVNIINVYSSDIKASIFLSD